MQRHAPAAERNRGPILAVLRRVLAPSGRALEIASGTGQHIVAFAEALPGWHFTPSDVDPDARESIAAWVAASACTNIAPPLSLDARAGRWPVATMDAVLAINMVHISPWDATVGLLEGAANAMRDGGTLVLYGPYRIDGATAPSNEAFDASLRARDPAWGVRELRDLEVLANAHALQLADVVAMPANNHTLVFHKELP